MSRVSLIQSYLQIIWARYYLGGILGTKIPNWLLYDCYLEKQLHPIPEWEEILSE